jgi:hypothetical protein
LPPFGAIAKLKAIQRKYADDRYNPTGDQDLQTPELTDDILYITSTYDTPHLPKETPYRLAEVNTARSI